MARRAPKGAAAKPRGFRALLAPGTLARETLQATLIAAAISTLLTIVLVQGVALALILVEYVAVLAVALLKPRVGIWALAALLPVHTLAMTLIYNYLEVPAQSMTAISAWKEALALLLLVSVTFRALRANLRQHGTPIIGKRLLLVDWFAIAYAIYLVALIFLPDLLSLPGGEPEMVQRLYGLKVYAPLLICYGIGRLILLDTPWLKKTLIFLFVVGAVTGVWGVIERFAVPLEAYVALGYVRYLKDVAHITYTTYTSLDIPHPWWALPQNYSALGLPENFQSSIGIYHIRRAVSTYLSSQELGISYLFLLPMACPLIALYWRRHGRIRRWLGIGLALMGTALLLSLSRGPILSAAIGVTVFAIAYRLRPGGHPPSLRQPQRSRHTVALLVGGLLLGGLLLGFLAEALVPYTVNALTLSDPSVHEHLTSWEQSIQLIAESPIFGSGLGTVGINQQRFAGANNGPESLFLQIAQETGLVGLCLYLALLIAAFVRTWKNWRAPGDALWRLTNLAVFCALVATVVDSATAPLLNDWFITDMLAVFVGLSMRYPAVHSDLVETHPDELDTVRVAARLPSLSNMEVADLPTISLPTAAPEEFPTQILAGAPAQSEEFANDAIGRPFASAYYAEEIAALSTVASLQSVDISGMPTVPYLPAIPRGSHARRSRHVARATFIVMVATTLASVLGFVREALIAREFGASAQTDAYVTALFIPNILQSLLISGSLTIIFIPILSDYLESRNDREAWRVVSLIGNLVFIVLAALTVAGIVFTPALVTLYAPFFSPGTRELTIELTQILFLSVFSLGFSSYFVAVLNAFRVFGLPALTTAIFNAGVIAALLVFGASFGIEGLAWATVAASGLQLLVAGAPLLWLRPRYSLTLSLRHPAARQLVRLALPQFASVLNGQVYFLIERILASGLVYGSISALNFANKLWVVPANVLGNSLLTVIFPQIAEEAAMKRYDALIHTMGRAFRMLFAVLAPISVLCVLLAEPLTRLIYERGAFGEQDVALTAACLRFAALGIFPSAGIWLCTRVLFALRDAKSTLILGMLVNIAFIGLNVLLTPLLGAPALALTFALDTATYLIVLLLAIRRHLGVIGGGWLVDGMWKVTVGSGALALAAYATLVVVSPPDSWLVSLPGDIGFVSFVQVVAASLAGIATYVVAIICLRLSEVRLAFRWMNRSHGT